MDLWYTEYFHEKLDGKPTAGHSFKIKKHLVDEQSKFQKIDILETIDRGKLLVLDGMVMLTENEEFVYHDMICHPASNLLKYANIKPKKALVIGGGDGGTVRELLKVDGIEKVILCEIDGKVVDLCKKYFPKVASGLDDSRVEVVVGDGISYVKKFENEFDLICIDSTDPVGPALGLFNQSFYQSIFKALNENGVMAAQTESIFLRLEFIKEIQSVLKSIFPFVAPYIASIPMYPTGNWCFSLASKAIDPFICYKPDFCDKITFQGPYYNSRVHQGAFAIPTWARDFLESGATN